MFFIPCKHTLYFLTTAELTERLLDMKLIGGTIVYKTLNKFDMNFILVSVFCWLDGLRACVCVRELACPRVNLKYVNACDDSEEA